MPEARAGHRNGRVNPPPRPTHRHGNEVMDAASSALALQTPPLLSHRVQNTSRTRMVQVWVPIRVGDGRVRRGSVRSVRGVGRSSPPDARGVPPARANVRRL